MYIRSGSDISLSCVAKDMPEPPSHFTWYKGLQILSTGGNDGHQLFQQNGHLQQQQQHQMNSNKQTSFFGKSSIMTSLSGRKVTIETSQHGLENLLLIRNAVAADSGNYTCIPAGAEPASIVVHVLNGTAKIPHYLINYGNVTKESVTQVDNHWDTFPWLNSRSPCTNTFIQLCIQRVRQALLKVISNMTTVFQFGVYGSTMIDSTRPAKSLRERPLVVIHGRTHCGCYTSRTSQPRLCLSSFVKFRLNKSPV